MNQIYDQNEFGDSIASHCSSIKKIIKIAFNICFAGQTIDN